MQTMKLPTPSRRASRCFGTLLCVGLASTAQAQVKIELKSGSLHMTVTGLMEKQIKSSESVPLTLSFRAADGMVSTVEADAMVDFAPQSR